MDIQDKIKSLRLSKKLSQEEVAQKLGISQPAYNQIEKGKGNLTLTTIKRIAQVLGVELVEFFMPEGAILPTSQDMISLPVVSHVIPGTPLLVRENIERYIPVPKDIVLSEEAFILKVKGDSMKDAGIWDGSYVVVKKQPTCDNGDIVAFLLNGENIGIRKFYKVGDKIILEASSPGYDPILVDEKHEFMILGKVTGWWVKK